MSTEPTFWCLTILDWTALMTIATFLAVVVAFTSPWIASWLRNRPKNSDLNVVDSYVFHQTAERSVGRIAIKNNKNGFKAVGIEVYVEEMEDNGILRENFLSVPLRWTHGQVNNDIVRDVYPNQTVWLDIFDYIWNPKTGGGTVKLSLVAGMEVDSFSEVNNEITRLKLSLYQKSGQIIPIRLKIVWNRRGKILPGIINAMVKPIIELE